MARSASIVLAVLAAVLAWAAPASASPLVDASPTALNFADHGIHDGNWETQTVTLTDASGIPTLVSSVAINGADAAQFSFAYDNCTNRILFNAGNRCTIGVQFSPSALGAHSATLDVQDTSGTSSVTLDGTGITGGLVSDPSSLTFSPQPYFFGPQQQGIQISNPTRLAATQVGSATITGPDAAQFSIASGTNCLNQILYANNSCAMGINFNPPGPGTFNAQLEVSSDAADSPLVVPLSATALAGPRLVVTPSPVAFGDVNVGQEASQTVTFANEGDFPVQAQGLLFLTGRPDVFFVTDDTCSGRNLDPGQSCAFLVHFKPSSAGEKDAPLLVITSNGEPSFIGVSGTGVAPAPPAPGPAAPGGAADLSGPSVAGGELACRPVGYGGNTSFSYRWLRDGKPIARTGATMPLSDADVGARFACELTAVNAAGTQTVRSPQSSPVAPMDLSRQTGAFTDERTCRNVQAPPSLRVGGSSVAIAVGAPVTPWAPLTIRAASPVTVSVDGSVLGRGRTVAVSPRALAAFADGSRTLRVSSATASAQASIALSPCRLALRVDGGPKSSARLAVSARAGMRSLEVSLPRSLRLRVARGLELGRAWIKSAGFPARVFDLVGARTRSNGVTVELTARGFRVTGLPAETAVVSLRLDPGVLAGKAGTARASASLEGDRAPTSARTAVTWLR